MNQLYLLLVLTLPLEYLSEAVAWEMFYKKAILKKFLKVTGKHLY